MPRPNPYRVERFMTPHPHTIGMDQPLAKAHDMMRSHQIRHLPVLHGGKLVGIVTQRDLHLMETFGSIDQEKVTVEEAMTAEVYVVEPATHLADVGRTMAEHRFGSAVVMQAGKVVGVFTMVDAARALSEVLTTGAPEEEARDLASVAEPEVAVRAPKAHPAPSARATAQKRPAAKKPTKKKAATKKAAKRPAKKAKPRRAGR